MIGLQFIDCLFWQEHVPVVAVCVSLELDSWVVSLWGTSATMDGCGLAMEELCSGPGFTNFSKYWWVTPAP